MRPRWASTPRWTDRLIVGRNVTLTLETVGLEVWLQMERMLGTLLKETGGQSGQCERILVFYHYQLPNRTTKHTAVRVFPATIG
jgi:hypothetical protein